MREKRWLAVWIGIGVLFIGPPAVLLMSQRNKVYDRYSRDREVLERPPMAVVAGDAGGVLGEDGEVGVVQPIQGLTAPVKAVGISPDGKLALCGDTKMALTLVDLQTRKTLCVVQQSIDAAAVGFSPDSKRAVATAWNSLFQYDIAGASSTLAHQMFCDFGQMTCVAFAPNGQTALSAGAPDRSVRVWNLASSQELGRLHCSSGVIRRVGYSADGNQILTVSDDGRFSSWDIRTGQPQLSCFVYSGRVGGAAFSQDGQLLLVGGSDRAARLWDLKQLGELRRFEGHPSDVQDAAFSADRTRALTRSMDELRLWDVATGQKLATVHIDGLSSPGSVALHPDGQHVLVGGSKPGIVRLIKGTVTTRPVEK